MKNILSILALLLSHSYVFGQDTIRVVAGDIIIAKVIEIDSENIKYKKWSNLEGPMYFLKKNTVASITYQNGEVEAYLNKQNTVLSSNLSDEELFVLLTQKQNKVFIKCDDGNAVIHATRAVRQLGYWIITENINDADFILRFDIRMAGLADYFGTASFIVPQTDKTLKTTKEVNTIMSMDLNTKRGLIDKIVNKEIKAMFIDK